MGTRLEDKHFFRQDKLLPSSTPFHPPIQLRDVSVVQQVHVPTYLYVQIHPLDQVVDRARSHAVQASEHPQEEGSTAHICQGGEAALTWRRNPSGGTGHCCRLGG